MEIEKVVETVFLKEYNTIGLILETKVVIMFWNIYMDLPDCMLYISNTRPGWVQTSLTYKDAKLNNKECGIKSDPIEPYIKAYKKLKDYALIKYGIILK